MTDSKGIKFVSNVIRTDPMALKYYILFEATSGVEPFESYRKFCQRFGPDVITYPEYEYWFIGFRKGKGFHPDRSKSDKYRRLLNLPVDLLDTIAQHLDLKEKLRLRKVNKFFYRNDLDPGFKNVSFAVSLVCDSEIKLDELKIAYRTLCGRHDFLSNRCMPLGSVNHSGKCKLFEDTEDLELALTDISFFLKNSRANMDKFHVSMDTNQWMENEIAAKFRALPNKISSSYVKIVSTRRGAEMAILPYLRPQHTKHIELDSTHAYLEDGGKVQFKERMRRIAQLEQCQQAEKLTISFMEVDLMDFPLESFLACRELHLDFTQCSIHANLENILSIKNTLRQPSNLIRFQFRTKCDFAKNDFEARLAVENDVAINGDIYQFPTHNSNQYLQLEFIPGDESSVIDMLKVSYP